MNHRAADLRPVDDDAGEGGGDSAAAEGDRRDPGEDRGEGGKMDVKMTPKAVSLKEETELQAMMERLEMENREVEGDEPEEE